MRDFRTQDGESGFMLVELIVAIALMAVVGGLASDSIINALRGQRDISARASDLDGLRQAAERITQAVRPASAVLCATPTALAVTAPTQSGGSQTLVWTISGTSLVQTSTAPTTACAATGTTAVTILANLDPAGAVFAYTPRGSYSPATAGAVNTSDCSIVASPGAYAPECIGSVLVTLRATLVGHPDLTLTDSAELRNQQ